MKVRTYAKINLTLDVVAKREDGFHDLRMVMVPIQLHDLISLEIAEEYSFVTNVKYLDKRNNNSVYQTIEEMRRRYGFTENFQVELTKYIPSQAGMGGGSSNAAATILLVNRLLGLNLNQEEMKDIAENIGKDVAFFLYSRSALAEKTGGDLSFFENNCDFDILLVKPRQGISTKTAYEELAKQELKHYPPEGMMEALRTDNYPLVLENLGNSFTEVSEKMVPDIAKIKKELSDFGFDGSLLCGSGSCVFALTRDQKLIDQALPVFRNSYPYVWQTKVKRNKNG